MQSSDAGILLVDKPVGPTSHDLVGKARRALGTRRVGHAGTLDPFASGLLLLCFGWATRLAEYLVGLDKVYHAIARLGLRTDTDDRTGTVLESSDTWQDLKREEIESAMAKQVGSIEQVPPAFSAKWVGGVRAHEMARRGESVELAAVPVTIERIELLDVALPDLTFEVESSSGTYIRSIARDLGEELGTGAHLIELRRTRVGPFDLGDAISVTDLADPERRERGRISPLAAVGHLPRVVVGEEEADALSHGARVVMENPVPRGVPLAIAWNDRLLAIGEGEDRTLRARKVFPCD